MMSSSLTRTAKYQLGRVLLPFSLLLGRKMVGGVGAIELI